MKFDVFGDRAKEQKNRLDDIYRETARQAAQWELHRTDMGVPRNVQPPLPGGGDPRHPLFTREGLDFLIGHNGYKDYFTIRPEIYKNEMPKLKKEIEKLEKENNEANQIALNIFKKTVDKPEKDLTPKDQQIIDLIKKKVHDGILDTKAPRTEIKDYEPFIDELRAYEKSPYETFDTFEPNYKAFKESGNEQDFNRYIKTKDERGMGKYLRYPEEDSSDSESDREQTKNPTQPREAPAISALRQTIHSVDPSFSKRSVGFHEKMPTHPTVRLGRGNKEIEYVSDVNPEVAAHLQAINEARTPIEQRRAQVMAELSGLKIKHRTPGAHVRLPSEEEHISMENYIPSNTMTPQQIKDQQVDNDLKNRKLYEDEQKRYNEFAKKQISEPLPGPTGASQHQINLPPAYAQEASRRAHNLAQHRLANPWIEYPDSVIPELNENELLARKHLSEQNPNNPEERTKQEALEKILHTYMLDREAQDAVDPYLRGIQKTPQEYEREMYNDAEEDYIQSIRDRADRDLQPLLDKIQSKYIKSGFHKSGAANKEINKTIENYKRGVEDSIAQTRAGFRAQSLGAIGDYQKTLGSGAGIAGKAASKGRENNQKAIDSLTQTKKLDQLNKIEHTNRLDILGKRDYDRELLKNQEKAKRFNNKIEHENLMQEQMINVGAGIPVGNYHIGTAANLPQPEKVANSNLLGGIGTFMAGMGGQRANQNPSYYKKGGRIKKATGGQVNPLMSEAITNAMIDKTDPISALRQLVNHNMGMEALQNSQQRQKYNTGGMVSPIQKGSQEAKQFVDHTSMNRMMERLRTPDQTPGHLSMLNSGMKALGNSDFGFMSKMGRAYTSGADDSRSANAAHAARLNDADKSEYQMAKDEYDRKVADRKALLNENILSETKRHHQAQESNWMRKNTDKTNIQTPKDIEREKQALNVLKANQIARDKMKAANDAFSKLKTSAAQEEFVQKGFLPVSLKRKIVGLFNNKLSSEDAENAEKLANVAAGAEIDRKRSLNPNFAMREGEQKAIASRKLSLENSPEVNKKIGSSTPNETRPDDIAAIRTFLNSKSDPFLIEQALKSTGLTMEEVIGRKSDLPSNQNIFTEDNNRSTDYKTVVPNNDGTSTVKSYTPENVKNPYANVPTDVLKAEADKMGLIEGVDY